METPLAVGPKGTLTIPPSEGARTAPIVPQPCRMQHAVRLEPAILEHADDVLIVEVGVQAEKVEAGDAHAFAAGVIEIPVEQVHAYGAADLDRRRITLVRYRDRSRNQNTDEDEEWILRMSLAHRCLSCARPGARTRAGHNPAPR